MKNRLKAILLAAGITASMMSAPVYAEATTENVAIEQTTESTSEAAAPAAADKTTAYVNLITRELTSLSSLKGEQIGKIAQTYGTMSEYELKQVFSQSLQSGSVLPSRSTLQNWNSVAEELGNFIELKDSKVSTNEETGEVTVEGTALYQAEDGQKDVAITSVFTADGGAVDGTHDITWTINKSLGVLIEEAALNTVTGIGVVFVALLFLSFVIGRFKLVSGFGQKKNKEQAAAKAAAPVVVPEAEEEELVDDTELVAVIAAAIASYENTSTDGFVVRSIRKANRKKWQDA